MSLDRGSMDRGSMDRVSMDRGSMDRVSMDMSGFLDTALTVLTTAVVILTSWKPVLRTDFYGPAED